MQECWAAKIVYLLSTDEIHQAFLAISICILNPNSCPRFIKVSIQELGLCLESFMCVLMVERGRGKRRGGLGNEMKKREEGEVREEMQRQTELKNVKEEKRFWKKRRLERDRKAERSLWDLARSYLSLCLITLLISNISWQCTVFHGHLPC